MDESTDRRAVFLDRDGTINVDVNYLRRPEDFRLLPGAGPAIASLNRAGWRVVVVTNQSGVARGYFDEVVLGAIHARMVAELAACGAHVDAIFYCPHHPDDACTCRKPQTGLIEQAVRQLAVDPARSWMIGDKPSDVEMGWRCGCRTVLLANGATASSEPQGDRDPRPDLVVADLAQAVEAILGEGRG